MRKPIVLMILLFITILSLSLVQIGLSNQMSTTGTQLVDLDKQIDGYKKDNTILQERLLEASSLTTLSAKAQKLGFVPENTQIDLSSPLPLALKQ